jgi:hypothetical protein
MSKRSIMNPKTTLRHWPAYPSGTALTRLATAQVPTVAHN